MENRLFVSSSPHLRENASTRKIMLDVIIALLPAVVAGIWFFGACRTGYHRNCCCSRIDGVSDAAGSEKRTDCFDLSAVKIGLVLNLPPSIPIWIAIVGSVIAIALIKQLFGGLGQNFMNPALGARVMLVVAWAGRMTTWTDPVTDAVATATPLGALKEGTLQSFSYSELFWGNIAGCIGETRLLQSFRLCLATCQEGHNLANTCVLGNRCLANLGFGSDGLLTGDPLYHILAGGLMLVLCSYNRLSPTRSPEKEGSFLPLAVVC